MTRHDPGIDPAALTEEAAKKEAASWGPESRPDAA